MRYSCVGTGWLIVESIHPFVCSFSKYLLSTCYVPVNNKIPCPCGAHLVGKWMNKLMTKWIERTRRRSCLDACHYRLNICALPLNSYIETECPIWWFSRWDLWEVTRSWGWSLPEWDLCPFKRDSRVALKETRVNMGSQRKTRKYVAMMLHLRDQRLNENDRLKPKKRRKIPVHSRKEKAFNTLPPYYSNIMHSWAHLITSWLTPALSTFPRPNWTRCSQWWAVSMPNVSLV